MKEVGTFATSVSTKVRNSVPVEETFGSTQ